MSKMIITRGFSINADTVEITVIRNQEQLFNEKYFYGYNASYDKSWATKDKPFIDDIIENLKREYSVTSWEEKRGENMFQNSITKQDEIR